MSRKDKALIFFTFLALTLIAINIYEATTASSSNAQGDVKQTDPVKSPTSTRSTETIVTDPTPLGYIVIGREGFAILIVAGAICVPVGLGIYRILDATARRIKTKGKS